MEMEERIYRDLKEGNFTAVPNELIKRYGKTLGLPGVGMCVALLFFVNRETGTCWPTIATLAEMFGCDEKTVSKWIKKLEKAGLISKKRGGKFKGKANEYRFTSPVVPKPNERTKITGKIPERYGKIPPEIPEKFPTNNTYKQNLMNDEAKESNEAQTEYFERAKQESDNSTGEGYEAFQKMGEQLGYIKHKCNSPNDLGGTNE